MEVVRSYPIHKEPESEEAFCDVPKGAKPLTFGFRIQDLGVGSPTFAAMLWCKVDPRVTETSKLTMQLLKEDESIQSGRVYWKSVNAYNGDVYHLFF